MTGEPLATEEFDKPGEACGVFGIYAPDLPVAELTLKGLHAMHNRGQDGAGISTGDGKHIFLTHNLGPVSEVFRDNNLFGLYGSLGNILATGHTLYSTSKNEADKYACLQPIYKERDGLDFTLQHNGNFELEGLAELAEEYEVPTKGAASDTQIVSEILMADYERSRDLRLTLKRTLPRMIGAYSLVLSTPTELFAVRDPQGFRPLHIGRIPDKGWVFASEKAALDIVRAEHYREVEPGEIVTISDQTEAGISYDKLDGAQVNTKANTKPGLCSFEFVYFSRPDNEMYGEVVLKARERAGELLGARDTQTVDFITGVPGSGLPGADGYARARGIPHEKVLVRNQSISRVFIEADSDRRMEAIYNKINPIRSLIKGKRVAVGDDSIVRGPTSQAVVQMLRDAGAAEVHFRVWSPPYKSPCFYGMATRDQESLIASKMSVEEIRQYIGADSLLYLTDEELQLSVGKAAGKICTACTTGKYPTPVPIDLSRTRRQPDYAEANA